MTRNLYQGAEGERLLQAQTIDELKELFGVIFVQAMTSNFELRMNAIADEIAENEADFVGIQEANEWIVDTGSESVAYNFLDMILTRLQEYHGLKYRAVAVGDPPAFDQTTPPDWGGSVRWSWRGALLVRDNLPHHNAQAKTYENYMTYDSPIGPISDQRSWLSVESNLCGKKIRIVSSHMESFHQETRVKQAFELIASGGPLDTNLAVVMMGDLNSEIGSGENDAVGILLDSGLSSAWVESGGDPDVPTWFDDFDLVGVNGNGSKHIDYILFSDKFEVVDAVLVDSELDPSEPRPKRPSDHAGVVATLKLKDKSDKSKSNKSENSKSNKSDESKNNHRGDRSLSLSGNGGLRGGRTGA